MCLDQEVTNLELRLVMVNLLLEFSSLLSFEAAVSLSLAKHLVSQEDRARSSLCWALRLERTKVRRLEMFSSLYVGNTRVWSGRPRGKKMTDG